MHKNCDVSRPVPANVMLCRSQPRCVALRLVVSCPCLKLRSHNCGVRVPACSVICPNTEKESSGADTWAQVLRHEREHLVVNASDKSGMRAQRHCETHNGHSGWFCLALPHHHSIVMTRALDVRIATHDSDLIVRGAVTTGTNKQPECIVRRMGLCHAIARGHLHVAVVMPMFQGPRHRSALACYHNVVSTVLVRYAREKDGSVARDVSVNGVPVF